MNNSSSNRFVTGVTLALGMMAGCGVANSSTIQCKILQSYEQTIKLGKSGIVETDIGKLGSAESGLGVGSSFSLDLDSGKTSGYGLADNDWAEKVIVLNQGGAQNSFQEVAISGNGVKTHTMYLEVELFSESREKPFTLLGYGGPVLVGACVFP